MSKISTGKLLGYGIPTVLFSVFGLHTLTSFIEGNNESRALTRLTSRSEREERIHTEQTELAAKLEKIRKIKEEEEKKEGGYAFGKRIKRYD